METARLAAIPLFSGLEDEDLAAIASAASEVEAGEGQTWPRRAILVRALRGRERHGRGDVRREKLGTLGPGDVFGEIAVLVSGRRNGDGRGHLADAADRAVQA